MVGGNSVGDLLENCRLACTRRGDYEASGTFADRCYEINDSSLNDIWGGLKVELFKRIDGSQVFEADHVGILRKRNAVDTNHLLELRASTAVGRLQTALDQCSLTNGSALDRVRRDKDVGRLGLIIITLRPEKPKTLIGHLKETRAGFGHLDLWTLSFMTPVERMPMRTAPVGRTLIGLVIFS